VSAVLLVLAALLAYAHQILRLGRRKGETLRRTVRLSRCDVANVEYTVLHRERFLQEMLSWTDASGPQW
jgi:hypothetical protein